MSTVLLLGAIACSSTDPATNPGSAGAPGSAAGAPSTVAGAPNSVAGAGTGGSGVAGASTGVAGTSTTGGAPGAGGASSVAGGTGASGGSFGNGGASSSAGNGSGGGPTGAAGGSASCSTFQLCDGFEGDAPGKGTSPWTVTGGTNITVVTDQKHGGAQSLHIAAPNTSNFAATIQEKKTFPAADFWGRAFLRFKGDGGGHQMYIAVNLSGDQLRLLNRLGSDNAQVNFQKSDKFYNTNFKIPMETWFCYEWHVTTSAVNIYIDGKAQTTNPAIPGITGGTSLSLGYNRFATGTAAGELWIDDVAVNDKQIGCQ